MQLSLLTHLAFQLNAAIDDGAYDHLSVAEVKDEIEAGRIFEFLQERLGGDLDLSLLDPPARAELLEQWRDLALAVDERRKFGVRSRGLSLLVAYLLEGVQRQR